MAHKIQVFLGLERMPLFSDGILKLERSTGMSGVDTKLIADIISRSHEVMRKLGLAPHDTNGLELYHALAAASDMGLLPDSDAWYNNPNYKHNHVAKSKRSGA